MSRDLYSDPRLSSPIQVRDRWSRDRIHHFDDISNSHEIKFAYYFLDQSRRFSDRDNKHFESDVTNVCVEYVCIEYVYVEYVCVEYVCVECIYTQSANHALIV
jgi:hypothetical protein